MNTQIRILVTESEFRDALALHAPSPDITLRLEQPDEGFGETLYPILVNLGITAIPSSVAASLIAVWVHNAWKRSGRRDGAAVGVEVGDRTGSFALSDDDVERIARRLSELIAEGQGHNDAGD
ncbi:hypothetical protein [Hoeflea olei]|uniref:hypothetical protein n=1 Tax=Hoeflea olei TaxID=1480615 RepID=UPI0011128B64|nr:hypothetical protein [Hoeflea olei]